MNYEEIYNKLIERAKSRVLKEYGEKHHIIPKCLGGSNDKDNIVKLTAREHFVAHLLLCEMYPNNKKLTYAFWMMCITGGKYKQRNIPSARVYERVRKKISIIKTGVKTGKRSQAFCLNSSLNSTGRKCIYKGNVEKKVKTENLEFYLENGWKLGRTVENKKKISLNNNKLKQRKKLTDEQKIQRSIARKGKKLPPRTNEFKQNLSIARKGIPTGRKGEIYIIKGDLKKRIFIEELQKHLKDGWNLRCQTLDYLTVLKKKFPDYITIFNILKNKLKLIKK